MLDNEEQKEYRREKKRQKNVDDEEDTNGRNRISREIEAINNSNVIFNYLLPFSIE